MNGFASQCMAEARKKCKQKLAVINNNNNNIHSVQRSVYQYTISNYVDFFSPKKKKKLPSISPPTFICYYFIFKISQSLVMEID